MSNTKAISVPADLNTTLNPVELSENSQMCLIESQLALLCSYQSLSDIAYAVNAVNRYLSKHNNH